MWVITPDEEAAIVAECKEYSDKKQPNEPKTTAQKST